LQSSEERSKGSSRPSLLTPAQQAEADRNRILTKLEHGNANPPAATRSRAPIAWGAAGALALALVGGGAYWMGSDQPAAPTAVAAASVPPVPVRTAAPATPSIEPAAAIHEEPAPLVLAGPAPTVETAAKPGPDDLRSALEEGTTVKKAPAPKPAASPVKKPPKPVAKPEKKPVAKAAPRKAAPPDSDLTLLSALVAHTQARRAPDDGLRALRKELKACTRLKGTKARDCREEACLGQDRSVKECR
jgi:hypothetical protein